jgi:hypothetical protein
MRRRQFLKTLTAAAGSGIVIGADDRLQPFAIQS